MAIVNNDEKKNAYVKKMDRQMKDWQTKIRDIELNARMRGADLNESLKNKLKEVKRMESASQSGLDSVKASRSDWAQKAKGASAEYRLMKSKADDLDSRVKKK